ncbi:MAG: hypothetical protein ABL871_07020 [Terricaulis sp.]
MAKNPIFGALKPALSVEVSLLATRNADIDLVHEPRRQEAVNAIVDCCSTFFDKEMRWQIDSVQQNNFSQNGMTVQFNVTAGQSGHVQTIVDRDLGEMERALESRLQSLFGWTQAAAAAQIEAHFIHEAQRL